MDGSPGTVTAGDGRFSLGGLPRGDLWITLTSPGFAHTRVGPVPGVGGNQDVGDLTIVRGGTIALRATCPGRKRIRGAAYVRDERNVPYGDFTVLDGIGVSGAVPPGRYHVSLALPEHEGRTLPVEVTVDTQTELVVELLPGTKMRVVCAVPRVAAHAPLTCTLSRQGESIFRFQRAASAEQPHEFTLVIGDGPYRLHVSAGNAAGAADFELAKLPLVAGLRTLTMEISSR